MKSFASEYGWTPDQVADLTHEQVWVYCQEIEDLAFPKKKSNRKTIDEAIALGELPPRHVVRKQLQDRKKQARQKRRQDRLDMIAKTREKEQDGV